MNLRDPWEMKAAMTPDVLKLKKKIFLLFVGSHK